MKRVDLKYEKKIISICKYIKGQITTYSHVVWLKFKLPIYGLKLDTLPTWGWPKFKLHTCDLKSHNANINTWYYLILYFYVFFFGVFGWKRHKNRAKLHI